jgi:uncharacterized protein YbjT (DUF2867 family)
MLEPRVLVVGATGQLGSAIVRTLVAAGTPVRAMARDIRKLQALIDLGVEIAPVDLLNGPELKDACRNVGQIVSTANNNMGVGPRSPKRIDLAGHQNLCAAARNAGVRRLVYVSARSIDQDSPVDIFRVKWYIEDAIRRSGVPHVIVRPTAFMEVWADQILGGGIRQKGKATIFGDGSAVSNYIAVDDVAEFIAKILAREDVVNEVVEVGGPSTISLNDLATLIEKRLGSSGKRTRIPAALLKVLPAIVRPFNERAARLISLGAFASESRPFEQWQAAAQRFGVAPRTIEQYVEGMRR